MNDLSWNMIFGGWVPVIRTLVVGTLAYVTLVVVLRISGKRTLSKMNAFDFIVTVALGSTLASVLTSNGVSLVQGVVALSLLIGLQFISTFLSVRSGWYRRMIKSQPTLLYYRGEYLLEQMRRQRITRDEILAVMRQEGKAEPNEVDAVVIETDGSLSVIKDDAASTEALQRLGVDTDQPLDQRTAEELRSVG